MSSETSAAVQREAEQDRAELASTLDQLRDNLRPENMLDEVMASARVSTADISDKIWRTARANPIPSVLIGLGAAMLLGVGSKVAHRGKDTPDGKEGLPLQAKYPAPPRPTYSDRERADMKWAITRRLDTVGRQASAAASQIAGSASSLREQARVASSSARKGPVFKSNEAAMNRFSRHDLASSIGSLVEEQPLVLAALGIAVGAAIGAAIPATEAESRFMGEASGSVKQAAQDMAQEQYAYLKQTAGQTYDDIKQAAADHGVSKDNLRGLVQDVNTKVRDAASDVATHASESMPNKG